MLKLLIADDFFYDREEVKEIISWEELNIEIVGTCENGVQGLEAVNSLKPDIVLTDIEMPKMDGFEFAENIKLKFPEIKVIFMSCHNDFEYARNALKLNVEGYITKPLMKGEILQTFEKICNELKIKSEKQKEEQLLKKKVEKSLPILIESFLVSLLRGQENNSEKINEELEFLGFKMYKGEFQFLLFELDDWMTLDRELFRRKNTSIKNELWDIVNKAKMELNYFVDYLFIQTDEIHFALLLNDDNLSNGIHLENSPLEFFETIREFIDDYSLPSITVVASRIFNDVTDSINQYNDCLNEAKNKFFTGKGKLLEIKKIEYVTEKVNVKLTNIRDDIENVILHGERKGAEELVEKYFNSDNMSQNDAKELIYNLIVSLELLIRKLNVSLDIVIGKGKPLWEIFLKSDTLQDTKISIIELLFGIQDYILNNKKDKKIQTVKKFIEANYEKQITLKSIADEMYFSPNYLNTLFKNKVGETIPDYIEKVRIEAAKKLLESSELKLYEIVESLGYKHVPYFNTIFHKHTGMTPKEYRKLI